MRVPIILLAAILTAALPAMGEAIQPSAVAVLRFDPLTPDAPAWVGEAIQRQLVAELAGRGVAAAGDNFVAPAAAAQIARDHDAAHVVIGSYQVVDGQLRVTGSVLDAAGKQRGALKASGSLHDLFAIEDLLATQVKRAIPGPAETAWARAVGPSRDDLAIEPDGPVKTNRPEYAVVKARPFDPIEVRSDAAVRGYQHYFYDLPVLPYYGHHHGWAYRGRSWGHGRGYIHRPVVQWSGW